MGLSYETQSALIGNLKNLLAHALAEGLIISNPAFKLKPIGKKKAASEKRDPFSKGQLQSIFMAPLYTGCIDDERNYKKPGPNVIRRGRFWVPLISLFSGLRLNEVCQLRIEDLKITESGTHFFRVTDEGPGMSVKSPSSKRDAPIHPMLVRFGLLKYRDKAQEDGASDLFPEIKPATTGYRSDRMSKWFNRSFLPSVIDKKPTTVFHSFRHNFRDALRRIEAPQEIVERLGGWAGEGSTQKSYGAGHEADHLAKYIKKVSYPDLDLEHLMLPKGKELE